MSEAGDQFGPQDFVLAFDFGGTKMAIATADLSGRRLREAVLPTLGQDGADAALRRALEAGRALVDETAPAGTLRGIGVSTMGITLGDRVLLAPNVAGWEHIALPATIRDVFSIDSVRIANDVKAAAVGELRWGALRGVDTGIYLNLGTGIATALIADGRVLSGAHGAAGEIAFNLRTPDEQEGASAGHAPLEEFTGGGSMEARARRLFGPETGVATVFATVDSSPGARDFVDEALREIAFHLTNLAIALDGSRIVVAGGLMRSSEIVIPYLRAHVERFVPFPPEVVAGAFLLDGGLMGAIALALDAAGQR